MSEPTLTLAGFAVFPVKPANGNEKTARSANGNAVVAVEPANGNAVVTVESANGAGDTTGCCTTGFKDR